MAWTVSYSQRALDELADLDKAVSESIFRKIRQSKENPHHFFERMVESPNYKLRVGDWRVIADLQETVRIIAVIRVGHRKKVYREV